MKTQQAPPFRFAESLSALAQIALRETGATGYALFQRTAGTHGITPVAAIGNEIRASTLLGENDGRSIALPLHTNGAADGFVAFCFADRLSRREAEEPLRHLVQAMETIWAARSAEAYYVRLARRLSALESQLMDSKIADRALGLLAADYAADSLDSLVSHVQNVFRPSAAVGTLEAILKELEDEVEERRVIGQAKAMLQAAHSMSEEEAYIHLRALSRKSRRRLKEIAADVMSQHTRKAQTA